MQIQAESCTLTLKVPLWAAEERSPQALLVAAKVVSLGSSI